MIRIGLISFPGSNCERETALAIKRAGMEPVEFLWNESLETLIRLDGFVLIGGFSYEDRSRAGIIAALDPVMTEIRRQSDQGKPVLGICNGAQILVEAGMVPGIDGESVLALAENKRVADGNILGVGFYNAWVNMRLNPDFKPNAFTRHLAPSDLIHLPVAHAQGRFVMSDALLATIQQQGLNVFQYCDENGAVVADFPVNPNGSIDNIAAISNMAGNVMAMMPHPERTENGDALFTSMRDYIVKNQYHVTHSRKTSGKLVKPALFQKNPDSYECLVKLIITDNQALTVQNTLRKLGFPVLVNRFVHWEINGATPDDIEKLKSAGVLFCDRKERECPLSEFPKDNSRFFLVRPTDDVIGQKTLQTIQKNVLCRQLDGVKHGVLWQFKSYAVNINDRIDDILLTNIIRNEYAHECYEYQLFQ